MTQDALNRRTYEEKIDNSLKAKAQRVAANPVVKTLNNMFPFGYDNSNVSSEVTNTLNSITRGKIPNVTNAIGRTIGVFNKLFKGVTNTDKAGQAMVEFADLDLSKPQNRKRAEELWKIANKEESKWGHLIGSLERRQKAVRARLDQNYLHGGFPQKYNTFSKAAGYTTRSNSRTYGYSDPEMKRIEQEYIKNYIRTNKPTKRTSDGQYIWQVSGGDPYAAHGDFSIIASDLKGTNARNYDEWDFGRKNITSNRLPGMKKVLIGIKAN